jgi:putative transposase
MRRKSDEAFEVLGGASRLRAAPSGGGVRVKEVCRKAGISPATFYAWKKKYGGLMPAEMKRLRQLEEESGRLKRIVADLSLYKEMLQDVIKRKL